MPVVLFLSLFLVGGMPGRDAFAMDGGESRENAAGEQGFPVPGASEVSETAISSRVSQAPESGTLVLIGVGMVGIAVASIRKKIRKR